MSADAARGRAREIEAEYDPQLHDELPDDFEETKLGQRLADNRDDDPEGIGRRRLLQGTAAGGAAVVIGPQAVPRFSPMGRAAAWDSGGWKTGAAVGAASLVAGPVGAGAMAMYLGDSSDHEGYIGEDSLHMSITEGSTELQRTTEDAMSGFENHLDSLENVLLPKGMAAVAQAVDDDVPEEEAQEAMETAINEHTAGVQRDVLKNLEGNHRQYGQYVHRVSEHEDAHESDVLWIDFDRSPGIEDTDDWDPSGYPGKIEDEEDRWETYDVELVDGSTYEFEVPLFGFDGDQYSEYPIIPYYVEVNSGYDDTSPYGAAGVIPYQEEGSAEASLDNMVIDTERYDEVLDGLAAVRANVHGELSSLVSSAYAYYDPEDIDASDVTDPTTAFLEFRNDIDDEGYAGAMAARMLGIPRTEEPMTIVLEDDEIEVEGSIYSQEAPEGGFDTTGETTYDPEELDYAVQFRYTVVDEEGDAESSYDTLNQPFTIIEARDEDGEEVESVDVEGGTEWDPSDVETLMEQLEQIREEQIEMQNKAESDTGSSWDWIPAIPGLGAGASALLYVGASVAGLGVFVVIVLVLIAVITQ